MISLFLRVFLRILFSFFLINVSGNLLAQVLDDSTVNVYGPNTSLYYLESDVFENQTELRKLDTLLEKFHRFTFPQRFNNQYVDLGNPGTALRPLFFDAPDQIGFRPGYYAYEPYYLKASQNKYFNTRSPYSKFNYVQGGKGISFLDVEYSRNINKNWNFGLNFRRITSFKQIGSTGTSRDREADHVSFSFYTAYKSKNGFYHILAHGSRFRHVVNESGGITSDTTELADDAVITTYKDFFRYRLLTEELQRAPSMDFRIDYHLYQQVKITDFFQLYHVLDISRRVNRYQDFSSFGQAGERFDTNYYKNYFFDTTQTFDQTKFRINENSVGVKSNAGSLFFSFYYKRKDYQVDNYRIFDIPWQNDQMAGFNLKFGINKTWNIYANGEGVFRSTYLQNKDLLINAGFTSKYGGLNIRQSSYSPSQLQQRYYGNHYNWTNNFEASNATQIHANLNLKTKFLTVRPFLKYSIIGNYIYFNESALPEQSLETFSLAQTGLELDLNMGNFKMRNFFLLSNSDTSMLIRVPKASVNAMLYYQFNFRNNPNFNLQFGVDLHWKSDYYGDKYMPVTQQFYLQNDFNIESYLVADAFVNLKVNKGVRLFAKFSHFNMPQEGGYITTPGYFGFRRVIDFGVHWMFFD